MGSGADGQWLLVSDVDDTLTGDQDALARLCEAIEETDGRVRFALNSSRPSASVDATVADYFPAGFAPDAIITGLGTEIRVDGEWLPGWRERFADWPRGKIAAIVEGMGFETHASEFQTPGKASFNVPGREDAERVFAVLDEAGLPYQAIYSGKSDLDLIAPGTGKDAAMRYLAEHFAIGIDNTVAAGDSGNDLAMFEAAGVAIAVGNARAELLAVMPRFKTYHARANYAGGVLEGLLAHGVLSE
ncbi:HAD-IIB family hydrolase [Rhizobium sp. L1K21]|uniref:HAD-IIB family hydrolase n=1 Tax=Rhizobium sp. L1K21 TaxID=2954933 RepID=UPI002093B068|nr:HAD-IIB family hydrolase [Rhizobium sp. L1K21]MCO6185277.1 HAD family hydrolase [Rhizobium sp. L1K21]